MAEAPTEKAPRPVTGRMVLVTLIVFFAVIFAVNGYLAYAAIHTFGGVETESAYKVGLAYDSEIAAAEAQLGRAWKVDAEIGGDAAARTLGVVVRNKAGMAEPGLVAKARLIHPGDRRLDADVDLRETSAGAFRGTFGASKGQRELVIELFRGDQRMFRSQNRITLR